MKIGPENIKVLVACEESQEVCKAFRAHGFEAYSCDIVDPSGGHPEWHIKGDALKLINGFVFFLAIRRRKRHAFGFAVCRSCAKQITSGVLKRDIVKTRKEKEGRFHGTKALAVKI